MNENMVIRGQILSGRIIQVLEEGNKNIAKIHTSPCLIDVAMDDTNEIYLGDEINIECDILVNRITPKVSENE